MEIKWIGVSVLTGFFLLELGAMAAFSYWGYHIKTGAAVKIILAVATPLVIATLWGIFSPRRRRSRSFVRKWAKRVRSYFSDGVPSYRGSGLHLEAS
ncbi:YrdB family protein [Bacillus cereus]